MLYWARLGRHLSMVETEPAAATRLILPVPRMFNKVCLQGYAQAHEIRLGYLVAGEECHVVVHDHQ
jgi:hypothetical protein